MFGNPFESDDAARWYASGRPDYSEVVADTIRRLIGVGDERLPQAADIGCGTGISAMALSPLAEVVIGIDPSAAMIKQAQPAVNVRYAVGSAEDLPLEADAYDLIGVGSALHWFDRDRFLAEVSRIAAPGAWLFVHDHWFAGQMEDRPEFGEWLNAGYLPSHPPPSRDRTWRPPADLGAWRHIAWERYEQSVAMDLDRLVAYLMTQSNARAAVERTGRTDDDMAAWLRGQVAPYFGAEEESLVFGGFVACHREDGQRAL